MFGPDVGIKLARRLKHEIRYEMKTELLFTNFLKVTEEKMLISRFFKRFMLIINKLTLCRL